MVSDDETIGKITNLKNYRVHYILTFGLSNVNMSRTAKKSGCNLSKSLLFVIVICSAAFLWFVYSHWPSSTFSSYSEKLYRTETSAASYDTNNNGHSTTVKASLKEESEIKVAESGSNAENSPGSINVIITFTKAKQNVNLQQKFKVTVNSILRFSSVKLNFYIIGDKDSQSIAEKTIKEVSASHKVNYEVRLYIYFVTLLSLANKMLYVIPLSVTLTLCTCHIFFAFSRIAPVRVTILNCNMHNVRLVTCIS